MLHEWVLKGCSSYTKSKLEVIYGLTALLQFGNNLHYHLTIAIKHILLEVWHCHSFVLIYFYSYLPTLLFTTSCIKNISWSGLTVCTETGGNLDTGSYNKYTHIMDVHYSYSLTTVHRGHGLFHMYNVWCPSCQWVATACKNNRHLHLARTIKQAKPSWHCVSMYDMEVSWRIANNSLQC